jgi:hypothetical protein
MSHLLKIRHPLQRPGLSLVLAVLGTMAIVSGAGAASTEIDIAPEAATLQQTVDEPAPQITALNHPEVVGRFRGEFMSFTPDGQGLLTYSDTDETYRLFRLDGTES